MDMPVQMMAVISVAATVLARSTSVPIRWSVTWRTSSVSLLLVQSHDPNVAIELSRVFVLRSIKDRGWLEGVHGNVRTTRSARGMQSAARRTAVE